MTLYYKFNVFILKSIFVYMYIKFNVLLMKIYEI